MPNAAIPLELILAQVGKGFIPAFPQIEKLLAVRILVKPDIGESTTHLEVLFLYELPLHSCLLYSPLNSLPFIESLSTSSISSDDSVLILSIFRDIVEDSIFISFLAFILIVPASMFIVSPTICHLLFFSFCIVIESSSVTTSIVRFPSSLINILPSAAFIPKVYTDFSSFTLVVHKPIT